MERFKAHQTTRDLLKVHNLKDWSVRMENNPDLGWLGLCDSSSKTIRLSAYHIDINPEWKVIDTIKHEVAHAIVGSEHGHDSFWASKAEELGAKTTPCGQYFDIPSHVKDAIRSGHQVEMEEEVITIPKFRVTRLQDVCPDCGKVAKQRFATESINKHGDVVKLITLDCFHIITKIIPRGTPFENMVSNFWKPEISSCAHEWNKTICNKCGEFRLFNFQIKGAQACEAGLSVQKGFGIFDEMGLGKTVQALAVIKYHKEYTPTMYVVKSAIKFQWFKEIVRWLGMDYAAQVINTSRDTLIPSFKSYVIAYDLLRRMNKEKIEKLGIRCVILDECQGIKNPDSTRTQEVRKLVSNPSCKVIALSGTPWKNRGSEFFSVLNIISPMKFPSNQGFLDEWVDYYWDGAKKKQGGIRKVPAFKIYTEDLLVRREYNEVMDEYPETNRMKLNVQLDALAQTTYDESVSEFVAWYNAAVLGGEEDAISGIEILARMSRMRHITGLAKIPATIGFIEEFIEDTDRKLCIFVHHKDVGELMISALSNMSKDTNPDTYELATQLFKNGIKIMKFTAELSDEERFNVAELFNKTPRCIMIASTLASGEGVNLQSCADGIMHERQWNPQNEDQALPGRFKRIGQKATVINGTWIEAEGTIDEHLSGLIEMKRRNFHTAMNKGEMNAWSDGDIGRQLAEIIVEKHREKLKFKVPVKSLTKQAKL